MRVSFLCTFEPHTAGGILTLGRARGARANGHEVRVVFQPFKTDLYAAKEKKWPASQKEKSMLHRDIPLVMACSPFFTGGLFHRLLFLPMFLLFDFWRAFLPLYRSDFAIIHKPLPLSFFYMVCLRLFRYRGKLCCVHSDWEGIGGYADIATPGKILRKLLVTFCEEVAPRLEDVVWCASKTLYTRFGLGLHTSGKRIYLSCGGEPFPAVPKNFSDRPHRVVYSGSYKSRQTVDFLATVSLQTCKESADFRYVFLGTGPFLEELRNRVTGELGQEQIECPGHVSRENVLQYLGDAHFALLYLNEAYPETYAEMSRSSTKLFEYLCAGTIVVASDFGEAKELLAGQDAAVLEENDPVLFAQQLLKLQALPQKELERISGNASALFKNRFSHEVQMKTLFNFSKA